MTRKINENEEFKPKEFYRSSRPEPDWAETLQFWSQSKTKALEF